MSNTEQPEDNYIPFGPEWVKEIKKMPKNYIIQMLADANIKRQQAEALIPAPNPSPVQGVEEAAVKSAEGWIEGEIKHRANRRDNGEIIEGYLIAEPRLYGSRYYIQNYPADEHDPVKVEIDYTTLQHEYASQFQASRSKGVGMQWVDAKERLPSAGIRVPVKYNGEYYKGFRNHDSVNPSMYIILCNGSELTRDCEWLDESAPLSDNCPAEGGMIPQWKNFHPRLQAFIEVRLKEAGILDILLKGCKDYDHYTEVKERFFKSIYDADINHLNGLSASPGSEGKGEKTGCAIGHHDVVPVLGYENIHVGEECRICGRRWDNAGKEK